jgi:hypothetical protein
VFVQGFCSYYLDEVFSKWSTHVQVAIKFS